MSVFAARMSSGLAAIYARLGDSAVYTNDLGYKTNCTVIVDRDLTRYGEVASINGKTAVVSVRISEITLPPLRGDSFALSDTCETFRVDEVISSDDNEHRCLVA